MNLGGLLLLLGFYSALMFPAFRVESKHRRIVTLCVLLGIFAIYQFSVGHHAESEGWIAMILALVLNFLFWLLVGRYNPPSTDDEIKVIGLDD